MGNGHSAEWDASQAFQSEILTYLRQSPYAKDVDVIGDPKMYTITYTVIASGRALKIYQDTDVNDEIEMTDMFANVDVYGPPPAAVVGNVGIYPVRPQGDDDDAPGSVASYDDARDYIARSIGQDTYRLTDSVRRDAARYVPSLENIVGYTGSVVVHPTSPSE